MTELGTGMLTWHRYERVSDRYGTCYLLNGDDPYAASGVTADPGEVPLTVEGLPGTVGTLTVEVLATRDSDHIGDLFRGIGPVTPEVGETLTLGHGELFTQQDHGVVAVGLRPADGRRSDWLDPHALYRAHSQTVRLTFTPED